MSSVILGADGRVAMRDGKILIGLVTDGQVDPECCCQGPQPGCCDANYLIRCGPGGTPTPICCNLGKRRRITATALAGSTSSVEGASDGCNGTSFTASVAIEYDVDQDCTGVTTCRRADFDGAQTYWPDAPAPACQRSEVRTTRRCINPGGEDVITAGGDNPMDPQGIWAIFRSWVGGRYPRTDQWGDWTGLPCSGVDRITNQPGDLPYQDEIAWEYRTTCESATMQATWTYYQQGANGTITRASASYYYTWRVEVLEACAEDPCNPVEPPPPPPPCRSCLFPNGLCCNCVLPATCTQQGGISLPAGEACPDGTVCDCGEGGFGACILFTRGGQCFTTTRALCAAARGIFVPGRTCAQAGGQGARPGRAAAPSSRAGDRWGWLRGGTQEIWPGTGSVLGGGSLLPRLPRWRVRAPLPEARRVTRGLPGQAPGGLNPDGTTGPAPDGPYTPPGGPGGCDPAGIDPNTRCGCIVRGACVEMPREQCLASGNVPLTPCRLCPGSQPVRVGGGVVPDAAGGGGGGGWGGAYGPVRTCSGCGSEGL